ncbi:putative integral membrane protein [Streptomyces viridochromogenes Tue57]|uniref:Putative integral membrane protein n=1 Tax=Streptomyces viridochromogenes Tue57 TaxID=1160705 RepID=L8PE27_STRVR|nr:putative integral membrane protein [Streptomyces viridochromogenes Tue57]
MYGGARRGGRSSSRSLVTVVGVVVLLIAAIAFANRGGDDSGSPGGDENQPNSSTTAASGARPVEGKIGGIPAGFTQDEQGAESAAANYSVALGSAEMFNTARRHEIVNTVYAPDVATRRQADLDSAYSSEEFLANIGLEKDGVAPPGQTFISRVIPVGTKTTSFSTSAATVEVWYTSLFGLSGEGSTNPVSESWYTTTYQLKWVNNDWKVTDFEQKDGPVPVGRDQRASTADDMTKAVEEYGGFTYAR